MRVLRLLALGVSLGLGAPAAVRAQAPLRPTILIDGHVGLDTILSLTLTKAIHAKLTDMLRGTGVGLAPLFSPSTDLGGKPFTGDINEVLSAERALHADILLQMNAMRSQDGNMLLAPIIILRHGPPVDMAPVSGLNEDAIARAIAGRVAKDTTRLRRLAAGDARADSTSGAKTP